MLLTFWIKIKTTELYLSISEPSFQPAAAAAKSLQSCLTLCNPIDGSPPGSLIPDILQARTLEWVAISFSNAWKWKVRMKSLSSVLLFVTPWMATHQAPPSMGFSRQEYWSGVPLPSPHFNLMKIFFDPDFVNVCLPFFPAPGHVQINECVFCIFIQVFFFIKYEYNSVKVRH